MLKTFSASQGLNRRDGETFCVTVSLIGNQFTLGVSNTLNALRTFQDFNLHSV